MQYPTIEKSHILAGYHPSMHAGHQFVCSYTHAHGHAIALNGLSCMMLKQAIVYFTGQLYIDSQ